MEMTTALINQWVINELLGTGRGWPSRDSVTMSCCHPTPPAGSLAAGAVAESTGRGQSPRVRDRDPPRPEVSPAW